MNKDLNGGSSCIPSDHALHAVKEHKSMQKWIDFSQRFLIVMQYLRCQKHGIFEKGVLAEACAVWSCKVGVILGMYKKKNHSRNWNRSWLFTLSYQIDHRLLEFPTRHSPISTCYMSGVSVEVHLSHGQ